MKINYRDIKKVLIYRLGSIGDTVVALPCFKLIARVFPNAKRRVLTNFPNGAKVAPLDTILGPMNLVHGYFRYPIKTRNPSTLYRLAREIRAWGPEVLVYLAAPRGIIKAVRDALFFKACGIPKLVGVPWYKDLQSIRPPQGNGLWESEASRLTRCLSVLGDARLNDPSSWSLDLTENERNNANVFLKDWQGQNAFVCASIGTKADTKDWGRENWKSLFAEWSRPHDDPGLVMVGSADEASLSEEIAKKWHGPVLNLCGKLTPRETAAVLERGVLLVGHDSGPMHLAAAVGTPCIAIFSARNKPGEWYPFGNQHRVLYHQTPCYGCKLVVCERYDKMCIRSITVDEVCAALNEI